MTRPAAARVHDWYLGGGHNFQVDRQFGREMVARLPTIKQVAIENRQFVRRAVSWLAGQGITQFLDLGSAVPTEGNVHQLARAINPRARTVYTGHDRVAVTQADLVLDEPGQDPEREFSAVVRADLRDPDTILRRPDVLRLIDFARPLALLIVPVLHQIDLGDLPEAVLARYREALPPGSYLVLSQISTDGVPDDLARGAERVRAGYAKSSRAGYFRTAAELTALFGDFELVEPGVTWTSAWKPERELGADPERALALAGVGRKP